MKITGTKSPTIFNKRTVSNKLLQYWLFYSFKLWHSLIKKQFTAFQLPNSYTDHSLSKMFKDSSPEGKGIHEQPGKKAVYFKAVI